MNRSIFQLLLIASFFSSCTIKKVVSEENTATQEQQKPINVILMIADGTGLSQISASQFYNTKDSNYDRFKHIGLIKTSSASDLITDSAAGATAFASGIKTYNGAIGVTTDTTAVVTILEEFESIGYETGVIATSTITHATPASFYAHVPFRKMEEEIALALTNSNVDFFAGGGRKFFNKRSDDINLLTSLNTNGFIVETQTLSLETTMNKTNRYAYLLADEGMPKMIEGRGSFLPDATTLGIKRLSQNTTGFFLMVEGSQVDWGGHANDGKYLVSELIDFDEALGKALDFAKKDGNTLVIVTADHETGGFTLASTKGDNGKSDYNKISPSFSTGGHSATMVPVFAYGPGATNFSGVYENTEIYHKIKALLFK